MEEAVTDAAAAGTVDRSRQVNRQSLGTQIADALRGDILFGRLRPDTRLAQEQLCQQFGTSRMPARDALRQLIYEGFLRSDGKNHVVVSKFDRSDLEDVYLLEGILHGRATRRAAERASDEEIDELIDLNNAMLDAESSGDPRLMAELNWAFHRRINLAARSPKLLTALRALSLNVVRDYLVEIPDWMSRSNREHEELLSAMKSRDGESAERLMTEHITEAGFHLIQYLESRGLNLDS